MFEIRNLTKTFKSGEGINNISFSFQPGDIVGLIGDNGAGKSTIIKTIFNEYSKDEGEILINNQPISKADYKKMSFFPDQSIYPKNISINDYCVYSGILAGVPRKECQLRTKKLLRYLSLTEYANKKFKVLSAGMQKRALLAITMVSKPEIIILDEPTANLDVSTRFEFLDILRQMAQGNKTVLITSHIINELQGLVNKLVIIDEGRLVYDAYVRSDEKIIDIYEAATQRRSKKRLPSEKFVDLFDN